MTTEPLLITATFHPGWHHHGDFAAAYTSFLLDGERLFLSDLVCVLVGRGHTWAAAEAEAGRAWALAEATPTVPVTVTVRRR